MKRWSAVDVIAVIIAGTLGLSFVITTAVPIILGVPISDARSRSLGTLASSFVAVLAVYVGAKVKWPGDDDKG